eukprot:IDg3867t1
MTRFNAQSDMRDLPARNVIGFRLSQGFLKLCGISADGETVFALAGSYIRVRKGSTRVKLKHKRCHSCAISRDGSWMVTSSLKGSVKLWKIAGKFVIKVGKYYEGTKFGQPTYCTISSCGSIAVAAYYHSENLTRIIIYKLQLEGPVERETNRLVLADIRNLSVNVRDGLLMFAAKSLGKHFAIIVDLRSFATLCTVPISGPFHKRSYPSVATEAPVAVVADENHLKVLYPRMTPDHKILDNYSPTGYTQLACCINAEGSRVVAAYDDCAFLWNVHTQQRIAKFETIKSNLEFFGITANADAVIAGYGGSSVLKYYLGRANIETTARHGSQTHTPESSPNFTSAEYQRILSERNTAMMELSLRKERTNCLQISF